jgi:hypothetical protein
MLFASLASDRAVRRMLMNELVKTIAFCEIAVFGVREVTAQPI